MTVVHVSYVCLNSISDAHGWLNQLGFFTGILERMTQWAQVDSIHCINEEKHFSRKSVRYHFLKLDKGAAITGLRVSRHVASLKPDVVIIHGLMFPLQVFLLQKVLSIRVKIYFQHHAERPIRFPKSILQRHLDGNIKGYFFTAKALAQPWVEAKQIQSLDKVHEVMEVSSDLHPITPQPTNVRQDNYLWVGRLDANKDPITLIKGFLQFLNGAPLATLHVIYRGAELFQKVKALVDEHPGSNRIVFMEDVDHHDLTHWYSTCGYIISTSHYEGSGTAVCEAMAFGCVPVLSDIPSFRAMTAGGATGFLFEPGNAASLSDSLLNARSADFDELTKKVKAQFEAHLSFDAIAKKIITIIS